VIESAECFGLAQLHQLRGRVGRGGAPAFCHLLTETQDVEALARLDFLAATGDGFRIAEEDLRRRGAGDLQGTRQTGVPDLRFADLTMYLGHLESARVEAVAVLAADPTLARPEHAALAAAARERLRQRRPVGTEAG
jgi:ATP-dependent DNA helicase RecG